jgi:hypothetical protein
MIVVLAATEGNTKNAGELKAIFRKSPPFKKGRLGEIF